ncbi:MAG: hypothetical protein ACYSPI_11090, partial [Planctomycetota bacterium]
EAGLPLYGHELGTDPDGGQIPIYAISQAPFAVSFDDDSRDFIGRDALEKQAAVKKRYKAGDFSDTAALPKIVRQFKLSDRSAGFPAGPWCRIGYACPTLMGYNLETNKPGERLDCV